MGSVPDLTNVIKAGAATSGEVPDANTFGVAIAPSSARNRQVRRLHTLLVAFDPTADIIDREMGVIRLARWVRDTGSIPALAGTPPLERHQVKRLRILTFALESFPALRERLSRVLQLLLAEQSALGFFAKMGVPGDRGLLAETVDRLSRRLMPQPIDEQDITELIARMFPGRTDPAWIASIPKDVSARFVQLLRNPFVQDDSPNSIRGTFPSSNDASLGAVPSEDPRASNPNVARRTSIWWPLRVALLDLNPLARVTCLVGWFVRRRSRS